MSNIRTKGSAIRIALTDTSKPDDVPYILVEPAKCWSSTFNAWGKKADMPIINLSGKYYLVCLEEVVAPIPLATKWDTGT